MKPIRSDSRETPLEDWIVDTNTDRRLLPSSLWQQDNSLRIGHCKRALRKGMEQCLSDVQREQLYLHYWKGLSKSKIAALQGSSCSTVCKSLKAAQASLHQYVSLYMDIYDGLDKELRQDE